MTEAVDPNYEKWLAALESGEYTQTVGMMFDGEGHCCLGVGDREVFGARFAYDELNNEWVDDLDAYGTLDKDRAKVLRLNEKVTVDDVEISKEVVGEQLISPKDIGFINRQSLLTCLNDSGVSFEKIAEFIRRAGWHLE